MGIGGEVVEAYEVATLEDGRRVVLRMHSAVVVRGLELPDGVDPQLVIRQWKTDHANYLRREDARRAQSSGAA